MERSVHTWATLSHSNKPLKLSLASVFQTRTPPLPRSPSLKLSSFIHQLRVHPENLVFGKSLDFLAKTAKMKLQTQIPKQMKKFHGESIIGTETVMGT